VTATRPAVEVGLHYAHANLLFGPGGEARALYRLAPVSYPFLSVAEKWGVQRQLERLAHALEGDFSLWRVTRASTPESYRDRLAVGFDSRGGTSHTWQALLDSHGAALTQLHAHGSEVYLAVSLRARAPRRLGGALLAGVDRARGRLGALVGAPGAAGLSGRELTALTQAERRVFERVSAVIGVRRARTRELEWLLRRALLRGLAEPIIERYWQPDALVIDTDEDDGDALYEPLGCDVWRLIAAPMREDPQHPPSLELETEHGVGYQALLSVGALADEPLFPGPGAELLHAPLDGVGFGVDAVLHARWLGNREALGQVRRRVVDAEQVYRDQLESRDGPAWRADDDRTLAREYEQVLQSGSRPPMLYASLSLAVGAASREELERRVQALRSGFGDVELFRPRGLQERLFFDHLVRADGGRVRDYVGQVSAQQFAAMVPTATTAVGDPGGLYLGYTPSGARRAVLYDVTAPPRESRASAVLLAGTLGSGKTLAAQLIAYGAHARGSLVIDFDPKPDHGFTNLPALRDRVEVLELTGAVEQRGRLDPLAIGLDELREELCCSYLLELLRDPPASWEHAITRAVRDSVRAGARGCQDVIARLQALDSPAGAEAGDALSVIADVGLARLGFGDGRTRAHLSAESLTTIRAPGLTLPEPGVARETYTRAERISVATLSLVAALALRLVSTDRSRHKVVVLDEAWFLLASAQGRAVVNRLVRLARAYNTTVLLVTQRIDDVHAIRELAGTVLIFGQDSDPEATRALELLGIQATPANVALLRDARQGHCLMRDLHGRVGEVQIDCADPELMRAFDTTPTASAVPA
jgi:hypothetical protein